MKKPTAIQLNVIAMVLLIICAGLIAMVLGLVVYLESIERVRRKEIYYPKDMPMEWDRIPGTNYVIAPVIENKRDTLRIVKSVEVNYSYQILTIGQKKILRDSLNSNE